MKSKTVSKIFAAFTSLFGAIPVAFVVVDSAVGADISSKADAITQVYTRTTDIDTPFTVNASGGLNFPVAFDLKRQSTLIISVTMRGIANPEREWGINCSGSTVTCHPFAGLELFHAGTSNTLSFTVVARNIPKGAGRVNLFVFAECATACAGTEQLTIRTLAAVVQAADE